MSADDLLATSNCSDYSLIVRTYQWSPSAVSLGYHQTIEDIDRVACHDLGWDVVRRPTGGRTLLHDGDLCYSIIAPIDSNHYAQLRSIYSNVAQAVVNVFNGLGLKSTFSQPKRKQDSDDLRSTRLCLESNVRGEVLIDRKKIAGASQRIYHNTILQHGSILIDGKPEAIAQILPSDEERKARVASFLQRDACSLNLQLSSPITCESFALLLIDSLSQQFDMEIDESAFTQKEIDFITDNRMRFDLNHVDLNRDKI